MKVKNIAWRLLKPTLCQRESTTRRQMPIHHRRMVSVNEWIPHSWRAHDQCYVMPTYTIRTGETPFSMRHTYWTKFQRVLYTAMPCHTSFSLAINHQLCICESLAAEPMSTYLMKNGANLMWNCLNASILGMLRTRRHLYPCIPQLVECWSPKMSCLRREIAMVLCVTIFLLFHNLFLLVCLRRIHIFFGMCKYDYVSLLLVVHPFHSCMIVL